MMSLDIYIYRGPEKDRKVISYSNSDRLLIYLFEILLISKSHNPSIMHQNLSSPVSERTKIKTREPSMSGPTSDGSKKHMENHWKITSFGNLRETIYKWVFPCQEPDQLPDNQTHVLASCPKLGAFFGAQK